MSDDQSLLARASALTQRVSWAKKYRQQWLMISVSAYNAQLMLRDTEKPDTAAGDFLESVKSFALNKCDKLERWIEKHDADLNRLMQEVDPDVATNR